MRPIGLNELREMFLVFFEGKGHLRLPGFSLIPKNDKSLLLINSGMAPLKPYFTGAEKPPRVRVVTCQKCIRTPDIDNVGFTARHGTFFEMLGNFSFGDYFKSESLAWGWEFFTETLEIPPDLLYPSVYYEDDEAFDIWKNEIKVPAGRIAKLGKEDNFWEHGLGPCGPCSEIYFDRGAQYSCGKPGCAPGCDCDRYVEVWNHVFTQFDRKEDGSYERLKSTNIDTGMGLERLACVMQGVNSIFEVDTIKDLLETVCAKAGVRYGDLFKNDVSIRKITDHVRSASMMVSDGVIPSNEGRGYVLRRLLRRAARHGRLLGISGAFIYELADKVIELSGGAYPELVNNADFIKKVILNEEERFAQTLDSGLGMFNEYLDALRRDGLAEIGGDMAFKLHDTYGFPLDLTRELATESGFSVDEAGFAVLMNEQRARARAALKSNEANAWAQGAPEGLDKEGPTEFVGYEALSCEAVISYIFNAEGAPVESAGVGEDVALVLSKTPFYAESGGQLADKGVISTAGGELSVFDCEKTGNGVYLHLGEISAGTLTRGEAATAGVDVALRAATAKNHTATHLLQAALKKVLGNHVNQSGSQVSGDRFRFDFNHFSQVSREQLDAVEEFVNSNIFTGKQVSTREMPVAEAMGSGAQALFGEKYGDIVRVVSIEDEAYGDIISRELCGGTHVKNTAEIGLFRIISEGGVAAGIRRIEAATGESAFRRLAGAERMLGEAAKQLKTVPEGLSDRIDAMQAELKGREREIDRLTDIMISGLAGEALAAAEQTGVVRFIAKRYDELGAEGLGKLADAVREREPACIAVFASGKEDRVNFIAAVGARALEAGADAGKIVKAVAAAAGGGGGGRRDVARAGGKDVSLITAALAAAPGIVKKQVGAE